MITKLSTLGLVLTLSAAATAETSICTGKDIARNLRGSFTARELGLDGEQNYKLELKATQFKVTRNDGEVTEYPAFTCEKDGFVILVLDQGVANGQEISKERLLESLNRFDHSIVMRSGEQLVLAPVHSSADLKLDNLSVEKLMSRSDVSVFVSTAANKKAVKPAKSTSL